MGLMTRGAPALAEDRATAVPAATPAAPPADARMMMAFFFFFFAGGTAPGTDCCAVSSESFCVACCPWGRFVVCEPSLTRTSPFRATIVTMPLTWVNSNSVHALEAGGAVIIPAWANIPFEVNICTLPCSTATAPPSNLTSESESTVTLEPEVLILRAALSPVCTKSPGKSSGPCATPMPFSQAGPYDRTIAAPDAAPESAAKREPGTDTIIIQQRM